MKNENKFQSQLKTEILKRFPGAMVTKLDARYIQGIPDLLILYKNKWATLECKRSASESHRPNQDLYVEKMNKMSFSSFIYPENKEDVLNEMEQAFKARKHSRYVRSK